MKKLKRFLFVCMLMISTIVVTACVSEKGNELLTTMELNENGIIIELKYYGKGDIAYRQTTKNYIPYSVMGSREKTEEFFKKTEELYKSTKGITYKLEYGDEGVTEEAEIDYTAVDNEEIRKIPGFQSTGGGDLKKGVSVSKSVELLKSRGFTEKK